MLLANLKPFVILGLSTLRADVLRNHLVGHVAARTHKIAPSPQVLAPELLAQPSPLVQQRMRAFALNGRHHAARSQVRRDAQEQVDMIGAHVARENVNVVAPTNLTDQVPQGRGNLPPQDRFAGLSGEDEMGVQLINGMGRSTVGTHAHHRTANFLKASPEGEGFRPPRRRH